jgi:hypothetical protein
MNAPIRAGSIPAARRPSIGKSIKERFADGKWRPLDIIVEGIAADKKHVLDTINGMSKNGYFGCKVERKRVGANTEFRIFKKEKTISLDELIEKLTPIVEGLKAEGKKNMATMSPSTVAYLAAKLQRQLDEWAQ